MANSKHLRRKYVEPKAPTLADKVAAANVLDHKGEVRHRVLAMVTHQSPSTVGRQMLKGSCDWVPKSDQQRSYLPNYDYWRRTVNTVKHWCGVDSGGNMIVNIPIHLAWTVSLTRFNTDCGIRPEVGMRLTMHDLTKGFVPGNVYWRKPYTVKDLIFIDSRPISLKHFQL